MTSILKKTQIVNILCSVVVEKEGKYLIVREAKEAIAGLWNFPSGKVEFGEDLIAAAQRETLEETGYKCAITDLMSMHYFYWDDRPGLTVRFNFWGKIKNENKSALALDVLESKWADIAEIEKLAGQDMLRSKSTHKQLLEIKAGKRFPLSMIQAP